VHKILLAGDVLIIEMMTNLEQLLNYSEFEVIALPPKFDTVGAFVRAFAVIK
jgi:kynurenine formamidase